MQGYSNLDTISLHITNQCNIRCKGCYLGNKRDTQTMSISIAKQAIEILQPKNVVFFGGESILCPDLLINIMSCYPNLNYILHTSGTIYNKYILDKVKTIALTLDAFKYEYVIYNKPTSKKIYNIRNTIIKAEEDWTLEDMNNVAEGLDSYAKDSITGSVITLTGASKIYTKHDIVPSIDTGDESTSYLITNLTTSQDTEPEIPPLTPKPLGIEGPVMSASKIPTL